MATKSERENYMDIVSAINKTDTGNIGTDNPMEMDENITEGINDSNNLEMARINQENNHNKIGVNITQNMQNMVPQTHDPLYKDDTAELQSISNELKKMQQQLSSISRQEDIMKMQQQSVQKSQNGCYCSHTKLLWIFVIITFLIAIYAAIIATMSYMTINSYSCDCNHTDNEMEAFGDIFSCNKISNCLSNITDNLCITINNSCELQPITTQQPSIHPSLFPTDSPTINPSFIPSKMPTIIPTINPSNLPTINPFITPSKMPTLIPTASPTMEPTISPSVIPTIEPTFVPTSSPTNITDSTAFNVFSSYLPLSNNGNGYDSNPIHIKTNWSVGVGMVNCMYNLEFKGHVFKESKPIYTIAIGYLQKSFQALTMNAIYNVFGTNSPVNIATYVASDGKLTFRLTLITNDWHASDLTINLIGGLSTYHITARNTFQVLSITHSATDL